MSSSSDVVAVVECDDTIVRSQNGIALDLTFCGALPDLCVSDGSGGRGIYHGGGSYGHSKVGCISTCNEVLRKEDLLRLIQEKVSNLLSKYTTLPAVLWVMQPSQYV